MNVWHSLKRIGIGLILFSLLLLAFAIYRRPELFKLEAYRHEILSQLEQAGDRRMTLGPLYTQLFPLSVAARNIVIFERYPPYLPIVSAETVRLRVRFLPIFLGKIRIHTLELSRARLILNTKHLERELNFPKSGSQNAEAIRVVIHDGSVELRGEFFHEPIHWVIDRVEGTFEGKPRQIRLSAKPSFLGPAVRLTLRLNPNADPPLYAELNNANLDPVFAVVGSTGTSPFKGTTLSAHASGDWFKNRSLRLTIDRLAVPALPGHYARGSLRLSTTSVSGDLEFIGRASTMSASGRWVMRRRGWDVEGEVGHYSPELARLLPVNYWIKLLDGPGKITFTGSGRKNGPYQLHLNGAGFSVANSRIEIPVWSAIIQNGECDVRVEARTTDQEGHAAVRYVQPAHPQPGRIDVSVSSVTVGDLLNVLSVHTEKPIGLEPWIVNEGLFEGLVLANGKLDIRNAAATSRVLRLEAAGEMNLQPISGAPFAHLTGRVAEANAAYILESLGARPAPFTGNTRMNFDVSFSTGPQWLASLNGGIESASENGFIRAGKVIFRIAGILNITNLIKHSDKTKVTKAGIPYERADATFRLRGGIVDSDNLKIRTPNMDIAAKGHVNLPANTLDVKIKLQFLNAIKEGLGSIPLVKRIINPDSGLFQVPVRLRGPIGDPRID